MEKRRRRNDGWWKRERVIGRERQRETGKTSVEGREADGERERGKEANERVRDGGRYRVAVHGAREKR